MGVNIAIRHTKQSQTSQGGIVSRRNADRPVEPRHRGQERQGRPASASAWKATRRSASPRPPGRRSDADQATYTPRLKAVYKAKIRAALKEEFGYKNDMQIPRLDKIVLNMGVGEAVKDTKKVKQAAEELSADRRPEGRHHQGQEVDRRLPRP
jgi:hypothetical protein